MADNRFKFTQATVRELLPKPDGTRADYWDTELTGFGVRVSTNSKTFFVFKRVDGRMKRATVGSFPALATDVARTKAMRMIADMADGVNPTKEKRAKKKRGVSLQEVFDRFIEVKRFTDKTRAVHKNAFSKHLSKWSKTPVVEIEADAICKLHAEIGKTTVYAANNAIRLLRTVLNFSRSFYGVPVENPVKRISDTRTWFEEKARTGYVKDKDLAAWFKAVDGLSSDMGRDYLLLLLFTGMRRNEAMGLHWDNIDLEDKTLTVPDTKNGEPLHLPLSYFVYKLLKDRAERWGGEGFVFATWGKNGHLTNVQHILEELRGNDLVPRFTLHDLRRTFATKAESLDISQYAVKRMINHKQTDVTGKHYIQSDVERLREPMERVCQALLRAIGAKQGKVIEIRQAA